MTTAATREDLEDLMAMYPDGPKEKRKKKRGK